MKKILIVLNDAILLSVFKSWVFRSQKKETIFFAKEAKQAIDIAKNNSIDLLVTELNLPEIDGLELTIAIRSYVPEIKSAFFLTASSLLSREKFKRLNSVCFIDKPNSLKDFTQFVGLIEQPDFQAVFAHQITLADFLKLIEFEKKTCLLTLENQLTQQRGLLYFEHGLLYDAAYPDLLAEQAALEILRWQKPKILFRSLQNKKFSRQIQISLTTLLAKAAVVEKLEVLPKNRESIEVFSFENLDKIETQPIEIIEEEIVQEVVEAPLERVSLQSEMALELKRRFEQAAQVEQESRVLGMKMRELNLDAAIHALQRINNYMAFAIFDMSGEVVVRDQLPSFVLQLEQISANVAMLVKALAKIATDTGLKKLDFVQMNFELSILQATWAVETKFVAVVLLSPDANNAGLARVHLNKICDCICKELFDCDALAKK